MKEYLLRPAGTRKFTIDYEKELNPQQLEVVKAGKGPILVIAGAGSGKTRTLTYRVARLLESGVPPANILLLTFTNKAAREMLRRVDGLLEGQTRRITGGTFHHVGNLVLRRHAELVGYKSNYTILDREDSRGLMSDMISGNRALLDYKKFPKGDVLLDIHSYSRNTATPPEKVIPARYPAFIEVKDGILQTCRRYQARKQELNMMDFDDLLVLWRDLIAKNEEVRQVQSNLWKYILVDEFQDTNRLQADIVERLAGEDGNLMVVGDDAQSIYSFRGAHFANIIDFPKRHPKARVARLETNYRSVPEILGLANSSIAHNERQFEKTLRAVRASGGKPEVVATGDAAEQAQFIAQRMFELRDEGYDFRDCAVLYRAHWHSMELQMELTRLGVPFQVRSGLRFFEQAHVKDVSAYLKIVHNGKDELAWKRVLKLLPRVGKATAAKVWALVEADRFGDVKNTVPRGARKGWEDLCCLLGKLRGLVKAPAQMIRAILEEGYEAHLTATFANFSARIDDLRRLADYAMRYDSVEQLLSELSLSSGIAGEDAMEEYEDTDFMVLSTVHQAKGLEWRAVFVMSLVDGKFPDGRALREEEGEEEERRLFYVATTRAKDRLFMVYPSIADERMMMGVIQRPSRFLSELDSGAYEEVAVSPDPFDDDINQDPGY